jgi:Protein of unknown function (DUF3833)
MNMQSKVSGDTSATDMVFDPVAFFTGRVACDGFITDRASRVRRCFTILFDGKRTGDAIDIAEALYFNDGEVQYRQWHIKPAGAHQWLGTANDIPTPIVIKPGQSRIESRWTYGMALPIGGRQISFAFEDVMVMITPNQMTALTYVRKFGITVAQIVTSYRRLDIEADIK